MAKNMYQKREERKNKKMNEDGKSFSNVSINWYPGHMFKTKKQIAEDLKLIDVVIEILDARIPISSQNPDIEGVISNKKKIVVLNKSDLADEKETDKWLTYFKMNNIIAISANSNESNFTKQILSNVQKLLVEDLEKAENKGRINKNIRLMIIGIPNVGKSSFINRMVNKKTAEVGNKPGVTKQKQWVRISNNVELMDTPGILWPKFENQKIATNLAFVGSIKDELVDKSNISYLLLKYLYKNYKNNLMERYKLTTNEIDSIIPKADEDETLALMDLIARKRGALISKGEVDYEKIAGIILTDFRTGKLGRITLEQIK